MRNPQETSTYPYDLGRDRKAPQNFSTDGTMSYMRGFRYGLGVDFDLVLPVYKMPFDAETYDAFLLGAAGFSLNAEGQPANVNRIRHSIGLQTLLLHLGYPHFQAGQRSRMFSESDLVKYRRDAASIRLEQESGKSVELVQPVTVNILPKHI